MDDGIRRVDPRRLCLVCCIIEIQREDTPYSLEYIQNYRIKYLRFETTKLRYILNITLESSGTTFEIKSFE